VNEFRPLQNFLNRWLGPLEASRKPAQITQRAQLQLVHPNTPADKAANVKNIKTFGTGQENMGIYGAVPISQQRVAEAQIEAKNEAATHEREINAPILTFNKGAGSSFSSQMNGIGLTDPAIIRGVQEWKRRQSELFAPFKVDVTSGTLPVKTFH